MGTMQDIAAAMPWYDESDPDYTEARDVMMAAIDAVIDAHIPSLTDKAEALIDDALLAADDGLLPYEDAAIRECPCGVVVDGFYEYVDHLKAMLRKEFT